MRPIFINRDPTRPVSRWNVLSIAPHERVAVALIMTAGPPSALSGT
jgi:hypothetical protein